MTQSMTGTVQIRPIPAVPGHVSKTKQGTFTGSVAVDDPASFSIVSGVSPTTPATLADLTHPSTPYVLANADAFSFTEDAVQGEFVGRVTLRVTAAPATTPGDHYWYCAFATATPQSTDVPFGSVGPFIVDA